MRLFPCILLIFICAVNYGQKESSPPIQPKEYLKAYQLRDSISLHIKNQEYSKVPELLNELKQAQELGVDTVSAMVNEVHAKYYYYTGEYEKSVDYLIKTAEFYEQMGDSLGASMMYNNISELLEATDSKPKEQLKYKKDALKLCPETLDAEWNASLLYNLSYAYSERGKRDSSEHYLKLAFNKSKAIDYRLIIGTSYLQFAKQNIYKNEHEKALAQIDTLIKSYGEEVPIEIFEDAIILQAETYLSLGRFNEAKQNLNSIKNSALAVNLEPIHNLLGQVYEKQGLYKQAYSSAKRAQKLKDSINGIEKQKTILELETKYETEKKENENLQLKQESFEKDLALSQKNTWILSLALAASIVISFIVLFWYRRTVAEKEKRTQIEQRLLRSQINPHFFFNVLNSIQHEVMTSSERKKSVRYIAKLSKLMRQTLETSVHEFIDLDSEIEMLENYITLQKIRYESKFEHNIQKRCEEAIKVPTQIIQPFVENAIEHGFKNLSREGKLTIIFSIVDEKTIRIEVTDNGGGFDKSRANAHHKSRALEIIKERLSLFNDPKNYYHTIETGNEGTHITIYCPYK